MKRTFTLLGLLLAAGSLMAQITSFPYIENFDSFPTDDVTFGPGAEPNPFPNGWDNVQAADDAQDWYGRTVPTGSGATGPDFDHTSGTGVYVFVEDGFGNFDSVSLVSPQIDISGLANPTLTYWVHSAEANGALTSNLMTVDVLYNGVWNNGVDVIGNLATVWTERTINLGAYPGVIQVRFKVNNSTTTFTHDIAIDDFRVFDLPQFDISLDAGNVQPAEYYSLPLNQASHNFDADMSNVGSNTLTGLFLNVDVHNSSGTLVYNDTISGGSLSSGGVTNLAVADTFVPAAADSFTTTFWVEVDQADTTNFNDTVVAPFLVTDTVMAKEDGTTTGGIGFTGASGEFGQRFHVYNADTLTSVSIWLDAPTFGDSLRFKVYAFDTTPGALLLTSNNVTVSSGQGWYTIRLGCGVELQPGEYFISADQLTTNNLSLGYTSSFYTPDVTYFNSGAGWTAFETVPFFVTLNMRANFGHILPTFTNLSSGGDTICVGESTTLSAGGAAFYDWSPGNVFNSATGDSVVASPTQSGTLYVTGTDSSGCAASMDSVFVTVNPLPTVDLGNDSIFCTGQSATVPGPPNMATYLWSDGSMLQNLIVTQADTYSLTVTDPNGCVNTDEVIFDLHPLPIIDMGNDTAFCEGGLVVYFPGTGFASYLWSNGATTPVTSFTTGGYHYVTVTDNNGCEGVDSALVTILPPPNPNLGPDTNIFDNIPITLNAGSGFTSYTWNNGVSDSSITVQDEGLYWVEVTDSNGCVGRDSIVIGVVPNSINELGAGVDVSIFPNPAEDLLNIQLTGLRADDLSLMFTDVNGRLVLSRNYSVVGTLNDRLDLSDLPPAVYLLHLTNREGRLTRRIIVQ